MKTKILFICKFNRFRSKFAEAYFNSLNENKNVVARSAGLVRGGPLDPAEFKLAKRLHLKLTEKPQGLSRKILNWQNMIVIVADDVPESIFRDHRIPTNTLVVWKIKDDAKSLPLIEEHVRKLVRLV